MTAETPHPVADDFLGEFGRRVRAAREALGLSQEKLAALAGLHWTYIGQIERGKRNIGLRNALRLADALGINPAVLVDGLTVSTAKRLIGA